MSRAARWLFFAAVILLFAYAALFPLLTIDTIVNVFRHSAALAPRTFYLLLFLESSRLLTSVVALSVAVVLLVRGHDRSEARALIVFLLFAVIAYEKVFNSGLFPGRFQEYLAHTLRSAGVPRAVMRWLFGRAAWPVWPAAAALLRFSAVFPVPLHAAALHASGVADRRGLLRSSMLAGADVGAFMRAASHALLQLRGYTVLPLSIAAVIMIVLQTTVPWPASRFLWYIVALFALFLAVTNLRAAQHASGPSDRARIGWLLVGVLLALFIFLASAAMLLVASAYATPAAMLLATTAPAALAVCLAVAVLGHQQNDQPAIEWTVRSGTRILAVVVALALLDRLFTYAAGAFGMPRALAAALAVILVAALLRPLVRLVDALRSRVLETGSTAAPKR